MTTDAILDAVAAAAKSRCTVALQLLTAEGEAEAEVEPYSVVRRRQEPTFYCFDLGRGRVVAVPVSALRFARTTGRRFVPRYDVEF